MLHARSRPHTPLDVAYARLRRINRALVALAASDTYYGALPAGLQRRLEPPGPLSRAALLLLRAALVEEIGRQEQMRRALWQRQN